MQLGFVSAILPDQSLDEVLQVAQEIGYETVELMCWPVGRSDRRYAGVTHLDVDGFTPARAEEVRGKLADHGVGASGLGYYPNPLSADSSDRGFVIEHLKKVMRAAHQLGLKNVNTFIGRDPVKSVDDNWPMFMEVWPPLVKLAEELGLKLGIENCPMLFGRNEWPGGKNLATSPAVWRRMFDAIPSPNFGLNLDPSHLTWLFIDPAEAVAEFHDRIFHVHAKDARIDYEKLQQVGIFGLDWHTPKLPGMGDVDWGRFFGALTDVRYEGAVCVEVEDRAFEHTFADRRRSLVLSHRYLSQYVV